MKTREPVRSFRNHLFRQIENAWGGVPPQAFLLCRISRCSRSRNPPGRNSRSRQNMQTTARRKKRQRTQSRALTVVLLAVVLLGLLVRAWTMGLMK